MKKTICLLLLFVLLCMTTACGNSVGNTQGSNTETEQNTTASSAIPAQNQPVQEEVTYEPTTASETQPESTPEALTSEEENNMLNIEIVVGDKTFSATLYDNETAMALKEQLPMTLDMSELNGNEKYYYLSESLPTNSSKPSGIHAGDLMLFGNNCLVLFYKSFSTSYSYTPLGYIDNPDGLATALGSGDVQVIFR